MEAIPAVEPTRLRAGETNAIGKMLGLLGDEWTLLLVNQALLGARRRAEFAAGLPINNIVLSNRLGRLEAEGLLHKRGRGAYQPTNKLISLWSMLISIWAWERTWVPGRAEVLDDIRHATCGAELQPEITCHTCHEPVRRGDIDVQFGPSGTWNRMVPEGSSRRRWTGSRVRTEAGLFAQTMSLFGNRWSASLLGAAFVGITRFGDFEVALGAPPTVVSTRLRQFVSSGVMTQDEAEDGGTEYELTDKGWAFHTVVLPAVSWAERWYVAPEGPAFALTHVPCGAPFRPRVVCTHCEQEVGPQDLDVRRREAGTSA